MNLSSLALFVPDPSHGDDFAINHDGCVLQRRGGTYKHVGPVAVRLEPAQKVDGKGQPVTNADGSPVYDYLKPMRETREQLAPSGKIQTDDALGGFWLASEKRAAEFAVAWAAELADRERKAAEAEANAKKGA